MGAFVRAAGGEDAGNAVLAKQRQHLVGLVIRLRLPVVMQMRVEDFDRFGGVPKIAAKVVIMIGRKRSSAASRMACSAERPTRRRSSAKSTIMMAFFLTMPTSMTMPIMAITDISMLNSIRVRIAPMPAEGRPEMIVIGWMK